MSSKQGVEHGAAEGALVVTEVEELLLLLELEVLESLSLLFERSRSRVCCERRLSDFLSDFLPGRVLSRRLRYRRRSMFPSPLLSAPEL